LLVGVILVAVARHSASSIVPERAGHPKFEIDTGNGHQAGSTPTQDRKPTGIESTPSSQEKSKESFASRAAAHQARLLKILNKLYFSEEGIDARTFSETKKHDARLKELTEELEAADDSGILGTVMLLVAQNSTSSTSIMRLFAEFQSVVRSSKKLLVWANDGDFVSFIVPFLTNAGNSSEVRTFAASALVPHTLSFSGRRPDDTPASSLKLGPPELTAISDVLKSVLPMDQKPLSQQLLMLTRPYMGVSEVVRQAYVSMVASAPQDSDLRFQLVIILKGQKWPVYEIQPFFDFMMSAVDASSPRLLGAVTEAFQNTPLLKGDDPRAKVYLDRLSSAYSYLNQHAEELKDTRDRREDIIRTVVTMDTPGAPGLLQDYLLKPEVSADLKEELLRSVLQRAASYSKMRLEMNTAMRTIAPSMTKTSLRTLAVECQKTLLN